MAIVKATIFFKKCFLVGTFERTDKEGYVGARHILDPEVYEFVLFSKEQKIHRSLFSKYEQCSFQIIMSKGLS
jgi:hypothetical protein